MTLTELAIKRPSFIVVIFAVLGFLGYVSYTSLTYELMPKFSFPVMTITCVYPGASPSEVENSVIKKVEEAVSDIEGVRNLRATSAENLGVVIIELARDANIDKCLQDAQRKVSAAASLLPKTAKLPVVNKFGFSELPVMNLGVSAKIPPTDFFDLVKNQIQPKLARLGGVAQVQIVGGEERAIRVNVKRDALEKYHISILQVTQAIGVGNLDFPTGKLKSDQSEMLVRLAGKYKSVEELRELIVVRSPYTNSDVRLAQIADVEDGTKDVTILNRVNGINSVGLIIRKQSEANGVAVAALVKTELAAIEKQYSKQTLKFAIASDSSQFTLEAADAVMHDLSLAVILVALVMLLFLHSLRSALIVMIAIPASLVTTFIGMYALNFSLNLMTLLGISLVIGILVDDSIVVLENIYRHMEMGKDRRTAALVGRNEIGFTALSITLVDVVVFLPLSLVSGLVADILRQFSLVVVISTLCSLFVSFTITPMLASRFASVIELNKKTLWGRFVLWFEGILHYVTDEYTRILRWVLRSTATRIAVLVAAFVMLILSFQLVSAGYIGSEFVNPGDRGEFVINIELPKDATLAQNNELTHKIENYLFKRPDVKQVFSLVGAKSTLLGTEVTANKTDLQVKLVPFGERKEHTDHIAKEIKEQLLAQFPAAKIGSKPVSILGGADEDPIQMIVSGSNVDTVMTYAARWRDSIGKVNGIVECKLSITAGNPEVRVNILRDKMSELGLTLEQVGATLQTAYTGNTDSKFRDGANEYDIQVQLDAFDRRKRDNIEDIAFVNAKGQTVHLRDFAEVTQNVGSGRLERNNRESSVTVGAGIFGRPSGSIGTDVKKFMARTYLPKGLHYTWEGNIKNEDESLGQMGVALIASFLFVYLIMVALYDSYIYPFVVLFSIPVALIGALLAMALTMSAISIFSSIGMVMLVGLVAKNAILIVDFTNHLKTEGYALKDALIESGRTRLRPILMTTLSMIIGMLPIALAKGAGAEWKNGLAWALVGGLTSSMLLTLVVVPVMYYIVDRLQDIIASFFTARRERKAEEAAELALEKI